MVRWNDHAMASIARRCAAELDAAIVSMVDEAAQLRTMIGRLVDYLDEFQANPEGDRLLGEARALIGIPHVPIPEAHEKAAQVFTRVMKPVPLSEVERLPDPDPLTPRWTRELMGGPLHGPYEPECSCPGCRIYQAAHDLFDDLSEPGGMAQHLLEDDSSAEVVIDTFRLRIWQAASQIVAERRS